MFIEPTGKWVAERQLDAAEVAELSAMLAAMDFSEHLPVADEPTEDPAAAGRRGRKLATIVGLSTIGWLIFGVVALIV